MGVASRKTGALFEWAGAVLSELSPFPHEQADPPRLACAAGILLQIVDDIHDYTLDERVSGKDSAADLVNRKLTLPCIYALQDAGSRQEFLSFGTPPRATRRRRRPRSPSSSTTAATSSARARRAARSSTR